MTVNNNLSKYGRLLLHFTLRYVIRSVFPKNIFLLQNDTSEKNPSLRENAFLFRLKWKDINRVQDFNRFFF